MCGFVGYFGELRRDLGAAARAIRHRGPDMSSTVEGRGWAVAFNRLSIIDLSEGGMQPFRFDDVTVYLNGEIYNYVELRDQHQHEYRCRSGSDVEIVPFLYRKYGLSFLNMLNGMFAMVLIDERSGKRFLVRDRFGKKPLFYSRSGDDVLFASEIKALKQICALRPDRTNIALNLACWFLVQPLSLYEGVLNVNPGCYVEIQGATLRECRWYRPELRVTERSPEQLRQSFLELYESAIKVRLRSDVPVGFYLSGGMDSISMAHLSLKNAPGNFTAFTARIKDKEQWERNDTDTQVVSQYCADARLPTHSVDVGFDYWNRNIVRIVGNFEELFTDMGVLVFYALSEAAQSRGVKVLFSGVGGDELFGGYPWQVRLRQLPPWLLKRGMGATWSGLDTTVYNALSRLRNPLTNNRAASLFQLAAGPRVWHAQSLGTFFNPYLRDVYGEVATRLDRLSAEYFSVAGQIASDDPLNALNYANVFTVLGNQNHEVDVASMLHSVENRSPLLDYRLVEFMLTVPDSVKMAGGHKGLMRSIATGVLPTYVTQAKKSGPSMPLHVWLGDAKFRELATGYLRRHRALIGDFVSHELARHVGRSDFHGGTTGALMTFALISVVLWAQQNLGSLPADADISFTQLAQDGA